MLLGLAQVIQKAKATLIQNAEGFADRHLPPYIEELLTLINFPSRLISEIIRIRLQYARKMKDPGQQGLLMAEQIISQFRILLRLAVRIKNGYTLVSQPEPGWDLPPCIDENFDYIVLDALKFYFKMLNSKLVMSKNTFKEAEILEQEWEYCSEIGRYLEGGVVEVAEQFCVLTSKALGRLTIHFERELQRRPEENHNDMDKRYKQILNSVRVRQRKLFRFSRLLGQRFENATEYNLSLKRKELYDFYSDLVTSGHFLVHTANAQADNIYLIASPSLYDQPREIQAILGTQVYAHEAVEDHSNAYILILRPEEELVWTGKQIEVELGTLITDTRPARLRLVADGSQQRLQTARMLFTKCTNVKLDILTELRANLPRVSMELGRIKKTTYKLSNTIMESVEIIRKQTRGQENQELIQTCFAFATEFGKRSLGYMDFNRRMMNNLKLTRLALDWISFICDDCIASDRKTFKWAVIALEFAMVMTRGPNILSITDEEFIRLQMKVSGCMSLLISHFDIMGARSTLAAQAEKQRAEALTGQSRKLDISQMKNDQEASDMVRQQWCEQLAEIDEYRRQKEAERHTFGRVLEDASEADRSLTSLSSSATNVNLRWQQGQFVGGGTFGSVYAAINLDSGHMMAVKEIRLQDPQLIPTIVGQIRDEMGVLQVLDHPNIVSYFGIEVHRDKVYIFMEYCSGGSLANLLEHGRIEDETVIQVYALQMLEGLAYLHASSIVHRDIKPESKPSAPPSVPAPGRSPQHPPLTRPRRRHPPRPQRRHQIRRLRRGQGDRSPGQDAHRQHGLSQAGQAEVDDGHADVHVARGHQRPKRRPPGRHRRLVAGLRDPGDGDGSAAVGQPGQRVGHHVQHRAGQPAAAAEPGPAVGRWHRLPEALLRARSAPPRHRRRAAAVRVDHGDPRGGGARGRGRGGHAEQRWRVEPPCVEAEQQPVPVRATGCRRHGGVSGHGAANVLCKCKMAAPRLLFGSAIYSTA
jgi:mitogen-activated protein kinase kinase kinase